MGGVFSPQWLEGIQLLLTADTEQFALDRLTELVASVLDAPVVGLLQHRSGYLHAHARGEPAQHHALTQQLRAEFAARHPRAGAPPTAVSPAAAALLPIYAADELLAVIGSTCASAALARRQPEIDTLALTFVQTIQRLRHAAELRLLADLSACMAALREPAELVKQTLALIATSFGGVEGKIFLFDERARNLVLNLGNANIEQAGEAERLPLEGTIAGRVVLDGHGQICNPHDLADQALAIREVGSAAEQVLCVPLHYAGRVLGALTLISPHSDPPFTAGDLQLLGALGSILAVLIANARLYVRAVRDALTGAYNRGAFNTALEQCWVQASTTGSAFALILLDLDDFKRINDRFGHSIGDQVLQSATRILWEALRSDDMIFRYGGEEFCVLLAGVGDARVAMAIAERLRAALDCKLLINGLVRVPISASLGVVVHPLHGAAHAKQMLDLADDAAYTAKQAGKNQVALALSPASAGPGSVNMLSHATWHYE